MIEQTQAHADFTAASTKFRLIMMELEKQRARLTSARDAPGGPSPVERFIELASDYSAERRLSKKWADSYQPRVEAHFDAAEGFEKAQLLAEIGIVLASLAVLLASRPAWVLSVILGLTCLAQLGRTYFPTRHAVREALVHIRHAEVEHREIGRLAQQRPHRLTAAAAGHDVEANLRGQPLDDTQHRLLIIDDEEKRTRLRSRHRRGVRSTPAMRAQHRDGGNGRIERPAFQNAQICRDHSAARVQEPCPKLSCINR